jgi:DNA-binding transcriptional ArsR family regulator
VAREARRSVGQPGELAALAHPLRLDLINYLMSAGPATASQCARAIGDSASNCSYHLRFLARHGLVETAEPGGATDGRERPWRATITGFGVDRDRADPAQERAFAAIALQRDQRLAREYLARRDRVDPRWDAAGGMSTYTLRMASEELADLLSRLDALIRPYIAATRDDAPDDSTLVHFGLNGFPLEDGR